MNSEFIYSATPTIRTLLIPNCATVMQYFVLNNF